MNPQIYKVLAKIMPDTETTDPAIALGYIRLAEMTIKAHGTTWEELLTARIIVQQPPSISEMLDLCCLKTKNLKSLDFLNGLRDHFLVKGQLSQAQYQKLTDMYTRSR